MIVLNDEGRAEDSIFLFIHLPRFMYMIAVARRVKVSIKNSNNFQSLEVHNDALSVLASLVLA